MINFVYMWPDLSEHLLSAVLRKKNLNKLYYKFTVNKAADAYYLCMNAHNWPVLEETLTASEKFGLFSHIVEL